MAEQADLYSEYSHKEQVKYGIEMVKPYLRDGLHVFDVGCGEGSLSMYVLDKIGVNGLLFGVDPDEARIQLATKKTKDRPNATFMCMKGSDIPLEKKGMFDVAICNTVIHWMDEQEKRATVNKVFQALKPGGIFLIQYASAVPPFAAKMASFLGKEHFERLENHWRHISLSSLCKMCRDSGFEVMHSESFEGTVIWENFGELMTLFTGAWGGLVDFRKVEKKLAEDGKRIPESWMINGAFHNIVSFNRLILSRPEQ